MFQISVSIGMVAISNSKYLARCVIYFPLL